MGSPNPLWVKSPLLLFRFRGLLIAVITGALLLALASASFPLFVSTTESSTLSEAIAGTTTYGAGVAVVQDGVNIVPTATDRQNGTESFDEKDLLLQNRFADMKGLAPHVATILPPTVTATSAGAPSERPGVRLLYRTDVLSHVHKLEGNGNGVWISDIVASSLDLKVGDRITINSSERSTQTLVGGIYEALYKETVPAPYWINLIRETYAATSSSGPPPTFVLLDEPEMKEITRALGLKSARFMWEFPVREDLTLPEADRLQERFSAFQHEFGDLNSPLGKAFFCVTCRNGTGDFFSLLPTAIGTARKNVTAIRGPVNLLSVAGIIVALTVIASAAVFAMARRRTESALLFAHGTSALVVGAKAALESTIPVVIGTAFGFGVAYGIFSAVGPSGSIDPSAVAAAEKVAAVGIPVAVLLLGVVSAISYLRQSESATATFRKLSRLPWEIVVLAIAGLFWRKVTSGGALVEGGGNSVARPSVFLLLFPIFFIGGTAGLGARALQAPLRRAVRGKRAMRPAPYLALHRLAGTKRLAILLVTAAALSLGILVYAQTVVRSLTTTIDAKATLFVGSDVQATVSFTQEPPENFKYPITKVTFLPLRAVLQPSGVKADVIVVDADTLAGTAYWSDTFSNRTLEDITNDLKQTPGDELPVLLAGSSVPDTTSLELEQLNTPIRAVDIATNFPEAAIDHPAVIVDQDVLASLVEEAGPPNPLLEIGNTTQFWIKGPPDGIISALNLAGARVAGTLTAEEVRNNPKITAVTRTFGYLQFLGLGAGLLAIVAVLMYLQARQRNRVVSYALSRRMGLTDRSHRISLVLELLGMLISALAISLGLALIAARLVLPEIDPLPGTPPRPLYEIPWDLVLGTLVAMVVVSIVGGMFANRSAERADFAEVMRLAA